MSDDFSDEFERLNPIGTVKQVFTSWQYHVFTGVLFILVYAKSLVGQVEQLVTLPAEFYLGLGILGIAVGGQKVLQNLRTDYEVELCQ